MYYNRMEMLSGVFIVLVLCLQIRSFMYCMNTTYRSLLYGEHCKNPIELDRNYQ